MAELIQGLRFQAGNPRRIATETVDEIAHNDPTRIYAEIPVSATSFDEGFHQVTYKKLSNAVNAIAWWLSKNLGSSNDFRTLAYIGPNNLSHTLLLLGAVKAGFKMLFTTPKYSYAAQSKLFEAVQCHDLILSEEGTENATVIEGFEKEIPSLKVHYLPAIRIFIENDSEKFPYSKTWREARKDPLAVLHTSGTTGFPKPIIWSHDWVTSFGHQLNLVTSEGYESLDEYMLRKRMFSLMPAFHASGFFVTIIFALFSGNTIILPPVAAPPSIQLAVDAVQKTKIDAIAALPPYLEQLGTSADLLNTLIINGAPTIVWAGATISQKAGSAIASHLKLFNCFGSTEQGAWPNIRLTGSWNPSRWAAVCIHPSAGVDFRQVSEDLYCAYIVRNPVDDSNSIIQPVFRLFPDLAEFNSKDLFKKHPSLENHWLYHGRSDDLQAAQSGIKIHPISMEQILSSIDGVSAALLIVQGLTQVVVLVEPKGAIAKEHLLNGFEEAIGQCNQILPVNYPLLRKNIIILEDNKTLPRTSKGSIQRQGAIAMFTAEINQVVALT